MKWVNGKTLKKKLLKTADVAATKYKALVSDTQNTKESVFVSRKHARKMFMEKYEPISD